MALLYYHPHLLLFVIFLQLISSIAAFSSSSSSINNQPYSTLPHKNIKNYNKVLIISKVQTNNDILSLAKLRYQEWMINEINPPLISNFCKATAEIYNERKVDGSIVFLAKLVHHDNDDLVVGAAELSSIELQNCITNDISSANNVLTTHPLYITDVVTSSNHRRFCIGTKLMAEVERVAVYELNTRIVFLHVEYDNVAARKFYDRLGYVVVGAGDCIERGDTKEDDGVISISLNESPVQSSAVIEDDTIDRQHDMIILDTKQLAINAGTVGQLLMMKRLSKESIPKVVDEDAISTTRQTPVSSVSKGGGFGKQQQVKQSKRKRGRKG